MTEHRPSPGVPPGRGGGDDPMHTEYLRLKAALFDPNTQLQSTAALIETVRAMFQRTRSVGIVHVEIDPLARVETVYGWQVLDDLLRRVAGLLGSLKGTILPAEALICQTGICAERFVVIVPITRAEEAAPSGLLGRTSRALADKIEKDLAASEFAGMGPKPAIAVGAVTVTEHPFFRLERQIYRAIEEARIAASRGEAHERSRQHAELKRIIRDQNVEVVFQPVVHLESGRIIGYEAFTRGPRDSIFETSNSLFEYSREVGMTAELDLLCQKAVLRQARRLASGDLLFLNALPASLLDPGFRESLLAELPDGYPITRGDIVLDIGDMNSIEDYEAFGTEVTDLRSRGFRMSLDDVGRGASTLENISEVGPDFIKIDNSLVRNIDKNPIKQEIVRSLCHAAGAIGAVVIAEGIETPEERETVMRCGASHGQGYLFYRPSRELPAKQVRIQRADM